MRNVITAVTPIAVVVRGHVHSGTYTILGDDVVVSCALGVRRQRCRAGRPRALALDLLYAAALHLQFAVAH